MASPQMQDPAEIDTWWCCYCLCEGFGLASIGSPICKADSKMLCIKSQGVGDCGPVMGDEGLCLSNQKCLCFSQALQCIPKQPFIEICGKRVYGPEKKGGGLPSMSDMKPPMPQAGNFGNPVLTLETCQKDLAEAIANEDFLLAHELKRRRSELIEEREKAIPTSIQMA